MSKTSIKLPKTDCNMPKPLATHLSRCGDKICDTCNKSDVCMYKEQIMQKVNNIRTDISNNQLVDINIKCKKWSGEIINYR